MHVKNKKRYVKPAVTFEQKIEAFAATCIGNPSAKASLGAPNDFWRTCEHVFS